jgi:hypothetical protein
MIVYIKTLENKYEFQVEPENYIAHLKDKIYDRLNIQPSQQRLIFNGSPMVIEYTLHQQDVRENSVIHLLMTMQICSA